MYKWSYEAVSSARKNVVPTKEEERIIINIKQETVRYNADNVSRTVAYQQFFFRHRNIKWAFLASMVSRNAGYHMTDLETPFFRYSLPKDERTLLFQTYERANWFIFLDAYPQLVLYEQSKKMEKPLFHLLRFFNVSVFMEMEWQLYWEQGDENRLLYALITNEQNLIQREVIEHPLYEREVFHSLSYGIQNWLSLSVVLFPTLKGEVYGIPVQHFTSVHERIMTGQKLAQILFHSRLQEKFEEFAIRIAHTGSRNDFEKRMGERIDFKSPWLRLAYAPIHHHRHHFHDWFTGTLETDEWIYPTYKLEKAPNITDFYVKKRKFMKKLLTVEQYMHEAVRR